MYRTLSKSAFNNGILSHDYYTRPHRPNVLLNILLDEHTFFRNTDFNKLMCNKLILH